MRASSSHGADREREYKLAPTAHVDLRMPTLLSPIPEPNVTAASVDVVFTFSLLTWRAAMRRDFSFAEDRLAQCLVDDGRVQRLVVADRLRNMPAKLLRDGRAGAQTGFPSAANRRLISPARLGPSTPASVRGAARAVAIYERALARAARQMGMHQPAVITANPLVAGFGDFEWARCVTYYGFDDWARSPLYKRWWPLFETSYERIRGRELRVAAVSPGLLAELAPPERGTLVPNGLEPAEWRSEVVRPACLSGLSSPILLYTGTLDYRLRTDWLTDLARSLPEATVLLVGPTKPSCELSSLHHLHNVVVHPAIERRDEYANVIRCADIGLIPHHRTPLTDTIEPQKVREYLAGGLPVVSADLVPIRNIEDSIALVPDGGDFTGAVRTALSRDRVTEPRRLAFVDANSWRTRHENLIRLALA